MAPGNLPFCFHDGNLISSDHSKSREGDVWAFDVVLFEILTQGEFPFGGLTDHEVRRGFLAVAILGRPGGSIKPPLGWILDQN